jgi:hypothetical protein
VRQILLHLRQRLVRSIALDQVFDVVLQRLVATITRGKEFSVRLDRRVDVARLALQECISRFQVVPVRKAMQMLSEVIAALAEPVELNIGARHVVEQHRIVFEQLERLAEIIGAFTKQPAIEMIQLPFLLARRRRPRQPPGTLDQPAR